MESMALNNLMMSMLVKAAFNENLIRSVPAGTVGRLIGNAKIPDAASIRDTSIAFDASPI